MTEISRFHLEVGGNQGEEGEHPKSAARSGEMEGRTWIQIQISQRIHQRGGEKTSLAPPWGGNTKNLQFDTTQSLLQKYSLPDFQMVWFKNRKKKTTPGFFAAAVWSDPCQPQNGICSAAQPGHSQSKRLRKCWEKHKKVDKTLQEPAPEGKLKSWIWRELRMSWCGGRTGIEGWKCYRKQNKSHWNGAQTDHQEEKK